MTFPKLSGFIHFSKTFPGLEIVVLKFHDFSRFFMTVRTLHIARHSSMTRRERFGPCCIHISVDLLQNLSGSSFSRGPGPLVWCIPRFGWQHSHLFKSNLTCQCELRLLWCMICNVLVNTAREQQMNDKGYDSFKHAIN